RRRDEVVHFIMFPLQQRSLERCFRARVFERGKIAAEFHLQRWRPTRKTKFLQFGHQAAQNRPTFLALFLRKWRRRLIVLPFDQLAGGRNAHAAKNSFGLADVNLLGRKINVGAKTSELRPLDFFFTPPPPRQRDFGIANIERVEKRLMMKKRGVINVERDLADKSERFTSVFVAKNANVPRDQTAKRIEREMANGRFDAAPMQFLDDA